MKQSKYAALFESIEERITLCGAHLDHIHTTDDIRHISIAEAIGLKNFCQAEENRMTKIAMCDLYHIIGMGDLDPVQMSKFIYKMKEYLSYRPRIKAIAANLDSIFDLPQLPTGTRYRLQGLSDMTLSVGLVDANTQEEICEVSEYEEAKKMRSCQFSDKVPFTLGEDFTIMLDMSRLVEFTQIFKLIFKAPASQKNLTNAIKNGKDYAGIKWNKLEAGIAYGKFTISNNYLKFESYYNHYENEA